MDNNLGRPTLTAYRSIPPPPPSVGSGTSSNSTSSSKRLAPPPPSIGRSSASGSRTGSKRGSDTDRSRTSKRSKSGTGYCDWESDDEELSEERRRVLEKELGRIVPIPENYGRNLNYNTLMLGRYMDTIQPDDYLETTYCEAGILQDLMDLKLEIRKCQEKFYEIRLRANDFTKFAKTPEGGQLFYHGNALQMANIDAMTGYQLTHPRNGHGENLLEKHEPLYFVDLCGGPGFAAEYFLWKKKWDCKGFGFTSKTLDYDLPPKKHYCSEAFEAFYGGWGTKGSGDVHKPQEVERFMHYVRRTTCFKGAHVVIANGGDPECVDEDKKELRCRYMFMSEILITLEVLREGGHFVMKIFDMFTHFTVGLIYLLYKTFGSVSIYKPHTAMTASSERFLLCRYKRERRATVEVIKYLKDCLSFYDNTSPNFRHDNVKADIIELIPNRQIKSDYKFFNYIRDHNRLHGQEQLKETNEIIGLAFRNNSQSIENHVKRRMENIKKLATTLWGVNVERFVPRGKFSDSVSPDISGQKLLKPYKTDILADFERDGENLLNYNTMEADLTDVKDWVFVPCGRRRGFFLGLGGTNTYQFCPLSRKWKPIEDKVELCPNSLVYADLVDEITKYEERHLISTGFHIIDAMILGGRDIRHLPYIERSELCSLYARSIHKPNRENIAQIRAKVPYALNRLSSAMKRMVKERLRGESGSSSQPVYPVDELYADRDDNNSEDGNVFRRRFGNVFRPHGLAMFRTTKTSGASGDFLYCLQNRLFWRWDEDVILDTEYKDWEEDAKNKEGPIHAAVLKHHIDNECLRRRRDIKNAQ